MQRRSTSWKHRRAMWGSAAFSQAERPDGILVGRALRAGAAPIMSRPEFSGGSTMFKTIAALGLAATLALGVSPAALAAGEKVSVITPFLAATATGEMIEAFKAKAAEYQWSVDVVDTAGDMAAFASRVEDATTSGANAIVLVSVDPAQIQDQVDKAKAAGVPVI